MNIFKIFLVIVIPILLLLFSYSGYRYASQKKLFQPSLNVSMSYEIYSLSKSSLWKNRFDFLESKEYNSIKRKIVGSRQNYLQVRRGYETYLIEYDAQIDIELIKQVRQVRELDDSFQYNARYFLVQYDKFVEVVYFDTKISTTPLSEEVKNGTYEAQICLELPIEASTNVRYHIDESTNIWIVTASMNKVVYIQIYSCKERKLLKQFRYILSDEQFVNQIAKIVKKDKDCMAIEVITYNLNMVQIQVCPYSDTKSIRQLKPRRTSQVSYQKIEASDYEILEGDISSAYRQEFNKIIQYIINFITLSPDSTLLYDRKPSLEENSREQFDAIAVDQQNNYLINFSKNTTYTGIISLNKYLINSKSPLFHNNPGYNKYHIMSMLDREYKNQYNPDVEHKYIVAGLNQTKKVTYKAAYQLYPDFKAQFLGLTSNLIVFWPQHKLDEKDYTFIRTINGGLISQGTKFKGSFEKLPALYEQIYQRVDSKAQQVIPGIFQIHTGYFNLMTYLVRSKDDKQFVRVQLLNMLGGKPILTHYINSKQGYNYTSTMLLNNQWWIIQYSQQLKRSMATKYQLFANASNPTTILSLKRVYGVVGSEQHNNGDDDLSQLMSQFINKQNNGYLLLSVFRCIDQYYYFQYTDSLGSIFGVARIHFKNLSNRRAKKNQKYAGIFERQMQLQERQMISEKFSRKAYSVYIKNLDVMKHIPLYLLKNSPSKTWHHFCDASSGMNFKKYEKLGGFYYFPMSHYGLGDYGCDYNSDIANSQKIYAFNLRNLIISGKELKEDKKQLRRSIILLIIGIALAYIMLVGLIVALQKFGRKKQQKASQQIPKNKAKSKKQKLN